MKVIVFRTEQIQTMWELEVPDTLAGDDLRKEVLKQTGELAPSDIDTDDDPMFEVHTTGPDGNLIEGDDPILEW